GSMPRTARAYVAHTWYHVLNRANRREAVFHSLCPLFFVRTLIFRWREPSVIASSREPIFGTWWYGCARARRTWSRCSRTAGPRATRSMCCNTVSTSRSARRLDRRKRGRNAERRRESLSEGHRRRRRESPGIGPRLGRLRARVTERPAGRSVAGPSAAP